MGFSNPSFSLPLSTDRELAVDWQQSLVAGTRKGSDRERAADFVAGPPEASAVHSTNLSSFQKGEKSISHREEGEKAMVHLRTRHPEMYLSYIPFDPHPTHRQDV